VENPLLNQSPPHLHPLHFSGPTIGVPLQRTFSGRTRFFLRPDNAQIYPIYHLNFFFSLFQARPFVIHPVFSEDRSKCAFSSPSYPEACGPPFPSDRCPTPPFLHVMLISRFPAPWSRPRLFLVSLSPPPPRQLP